MTKIQSNCSAEQRGAVLLAWGFSAFIAIEWLLVAIFAAPTRLLAWIILAAVVDIGFYWLEAHYAFEFHELEFSITFVVIPIMAGILIPVFIQAERSAKLRQERELRRLQSENRIDDSTVPPRTERGGGEGGK